MPDMTSAASRPSAAPGRFAAQGCSSCLGQLTLWEAVARRLHRRDWPETNVGASVARDAPRGRRSISKPQKIPRQAPPPTQSITANSHQPPPHRPRIKPPLRHNPDAKKPPTHPLSPNAIRPFVPFLTFFEKYFSILALKHPPSISPFIYRDETPQCYQIETIYH